MVREKRDSHYMLCIWGKDSLCILAPGVAYFFTGGCWDALAQNTTGTGPKCYISSCFKYSPNKQTFSHIKLACFPYSVKLSKICLPQIKQALGYKDSKLLLPFGIVWPKASLPSCCVTSYISPLDTKIPRCCTW